MMKLVVITPEQILENEVSAINRLFAEGMEILHLRKPNVSVQELRTMLEEVNSNYYNRIVLHDHFELTSLYRLKGVHLNRRNPIPPPRPNISVSKSCHSLNELSEAGNYSYMFLSPVFDSISKNGYHRSFTEEELLSAGKKGLIQYRIYALGGISKEEIPLAAGYGFGGVAVLGGLWSDFAQNQDEDTLVRRFSELKNKCLEY